MGWYNGRILSGRGGRDMFRGWGGEICFEGEREGGGVMGWFFLLGGEGKF